MSTAVRESFLERNWGVLVIVFGLVLTAFFALYNPLVPGEGHTMQTASQVRTDGTRSAGAPAKE